MAGRGAPKGNQNARKKSKMLTDALKRELTQNPEDVLKVTRKLLEAAQNGESWAQSLIWERMDGKVAQALIGDDDEDPITMVQKVLLGNLDDGSDSSASS
jgi:hypothetical protein